MGVNNGETPDLGQEGLLPGAGPGGVHEAYLPITSPGLWEQVSCLAGGAPEQGYQERQPLASASIKGFGQLGDRWRNTSFPRPLLVTFCL